MSNNNSSLM